jgi:hypothetical protein
MNTETTDNKGRDEARADIKPLTAKEVLKLELRPIEVPEGAEVVLSPADPEYASCFARVRIQSYDDLQTLGFVPRRLAEDKVRQALAADDGEVYELAGKLRQQPAGGCGCSDAAAQGSMLRTSPVRGIYNAIRKRHNPALARVVADHYGSQTTWDAPVPAILRKWMVAISAKPNIVVVVIGNITINKNATLAVAPSSKSLLAWNIWIHSTGKLIAQGSYLKVWANSVSRFPNFLSVADVDTAMKVAPIWSLTD